MSDTRTPPPLAPPPAQQLAPEPRWSNGQKLAFRLLFVIGGGVLLFSVLGNAGLAMLWNVTGIWWLLAQIGSYLTRGRGVEVVLNNSGDQLWQWCMNLGIIVVGVVIVAVWTALDRHRPNYRSLAGLLEVWARAGLALSMIIYGLIKTIPTQMGFMSMPSHQLRLTGDTGLFNTLWGFMGASDGYSIATGLVELTAGLLLLWRRTSLLGSLLAVIAMGQVSLLNLFYDVPVKIVAWQLFAIAVLLTLRYREPLVRVALNRPGAEPVAPLPVAGAQRSWLRIVGLSVKYLAAALLFVSTAGQGVLSYYVIHTPRTPLDGVWRATAVSVDGAPAALTDRTPWTNLAITMRGNVDNPVMKAYSTAYDSVVTQDVTGYTKAWLVEQEGEVLTLRKQKDDKPFPVTVRLDGDRLRLTTVLDGHRIESTYERRAMDRDASHIRLVQPDGPAGGTGPAPGN